MSEKKESKILEFIKEAVRLVGASAGVILLAIGMVMLLQAVLKLYVFEVKIDRYFDASFACARFDPSAPQIVPDKVPSGGGVYVGRSDNKMSKEEMEQKYQDCMKKEQERAEKRYKEGKKEDMADGIAFLLAGLLLLVAFRFKRK